MNFYFWLTGNHGNLESTEKSESAENMESTEKMTLRLVSFHKTSSFETKSLTFMTYFKSSTSSGKSYLKKQPNILTQIEMFLTMMS